MKDAIKKRIGEARGRSDQGLPAPRGQWAQKLDKEHATKYVRVKSDRKNQTHLDTFDMKDHPQWGEIHADIVMSHLSPLQICRKYELRTQNGSFMLGQVCGYRQRLLAKFPEIFNTLDSMGQRALLEEYTEYLRSAISSAEDTREFARAKTMKLGKLGEIEVPNPDFGAMLGAEKLRLDAIDRFGAFVGAKPADSNVQTPHNQPVNVKNVTVLSMPRVEGAPLKRQRVIEAKSVEGEAAQQVLDTISEDMV